MKKIFRLCFVIMLVLTLASCGNSPNLSTIADVDGEKVPTALFEYSLAEVKTDIENDGLAPDDWEAGEIDGENANDYVKNLAQEKIKEIYAIRAYAKNNGIEITSQDFKEIDEQMNEWKENFGGESEFNVALDEIGIDQAVFKEILLNAKYEKKVQEYYIASLTETQKKEYYLSEMKRAKHILLKTIDEDNNALSDDEIATAKATAKQVLEKAKAKGADFENLIEDYSEDTGSSTVPDGYVLGKYTSSFVKPFLNSALGLSIGGISEIVESDYGFHIIKVYAVIEEQFEDNIEDVENNLWGVKKEQIAKDAKINVNEELYNQIVVK